VAIPGEAYSVLCFIKVKLSVKVKLFFVIIKAVKLMR